jgi:L-histidine Nalpha-methyltransferase
MASPVPNPAIGEFLCDVVTGLSQERKTLPPKYFYDDVGSALFEAITVLPEYGLTRADARLIQRHAPQLASMIKGRPRIVELGSGSGRKTRWILEAFGRPMYDAIDVSRAALDQCRQELSKFSRVKLHLGTYMEGMREVAAERGRSPLLLLFLGSTIGNFDPPAARAFLRQLRGYLRQGDSLLIGFDLIKSRKQLIAAYDDPAGVTAAFNKNLLARINRELCADFDLRSFDHEVRYNEKEQRIEMHLRSRVAQTVHLEAAAREFNFVRGETIWTESSHKFSRTALASIAQETGYSEEVQWVDSEWPLAESLWIAQ